MSFINICRDNTDPFYRYKMPALQSKIEGRGNGIKTAIVNTSEVARALGRPPAYLIKYFGFELGAQTSINESTDRYLVNGAHDAPKLQDYLDGFINKFILCGSCKNPETDIIITKDDNLIRDCKACGQRTNIDPRLKLSGYILKNPPESAKGGSKKKKSATASANVVGGGLSISDIASGNKKPTTAPKDDEGADSDEDALTRKINAEASALPEAQIADDDWAVDVSEEAVRKRAAELEAMNLDNGASADSKYDEFGEWLLGFGDDKSELPNDVEIYKKAFELEINEEVHTVQVLAQVLFDENVVKQIASHKGLLSKIITTEKHEKAFLGGLERFLGLDRPELLAQISKILLQVYENDIVNEDTIKDWGSKVSKKYVSKDISKKVKKAARPFIEWLNEAEEEEESSDEESD